MLWQNARVGVGGFDQFKFLLPSVRLPVFVKCDGSVVRFDWSVRVCRAVLLYQRSYDPTYRCLPTPHNHGLPPAYQLSVSSLSYHQPINCLPAAYQLPSAYQLSTSSLSYHQPIPAVYQLYRIRRHSHAIVQFSVLHFWPRVFFAVIQVVCAAGANPFSNLTTP